MIKINLICIGKIKENYITSGINEYLKRLSKFAKITITELPNVKEPKILNESEINLIKKKETENITNHIRKNSYIIALTPDATQFSSTELANKLSNIYLQNSNIAFIIGGSYGLDFSVLKNVDLKLSFSKLTFPHQLFRLIFFEQLYRCFKIQNNESYDK